MVVTELFWLKRALLKSPPERTKAPVLKVPPAGVALVSVVVEPVGRERHTFVSFVPEKLATFVERDTLAQLRSALSKLEAVEPPSDGVSMTRLHARRSSPLKSPGRRQNHRAFMQLANDASQASPTPFLSASAWSTVGHAGAIVARVGDPVPVAVGPGPRRW